MSTYTEFLASKRREVAAVGPTINAGDFTAEEACASYRAAKRVLHPFWSGAPCPTCNEAAVSTPKENQT